MVSVADTEHDHNHAEKLRQKTMQRNATNKPTTLVDLFYVEEDGVSRRHHHSSKAHGVKHSYSSVWYKKSAGYTTHTFSEDLKQLPQLSWMAMAQVKIFTVTVQSPRIARAFAFAHP